MPTHKEDHPARIPPVLEIVPDQWYVVLEAKNLRDKPLAVRRFGEDLVLYRTESGAIHCLVDRCPHRGVALSLGRVSGEELVCRYHGFHFRGDGKCTYMPCEGADARIPKAMQAISFPVQEKHGLVWVFWGAAKENLPPIPWIDDLPSDTQYAWDLSIVWPVPTFRTIQANFDAHHAAFLHGPRSLFFTPTRKLIRADDARCEATESSIEFHVTMREEKPGGHQLEVHTSFRMPGVTYARLGRFGLLGLFDTPIDASNTFRVFRNVSPFGHAKGLGKLYAQASAVVDYWLGSQYMEDLPVVKTQATPSDLFSDVFIPTDTGTVHYEQLRQKLLRAARNRADSYPRTVRLRLGQLREDKVSLPVLDAH